MAQLTIWTQLSENRRKPVCANIDMTGYCIYFRSIATVPGWTALRLRCAIHHARFLLSPGFLTLDLPCYLRDLLTPYLLLSESELLRTRINVSDCA